MKECSICLRSGPREPSLRSALLISYKQVRSLAHTPSPEILVLATLGAACLHIVHGMAMPNVNLRLVVASFGRVW